MLRWVSPIQNMARTASRDVELRGQRVRAGDKVLLLYPSANRDESVFAAPNQFDIGRYPNQHIAFGIGEHFCLGANLGRLELQVMFRQLAERVDAVEVTGPIQRMRSSFVGGIKHMPVRIKVRARN